MPNTIAQVETISAMALEVALGLVKHPFMTGFDTIPGYSMEIYLELDVEAENHKIIGKNKATFHAPLYKRSLFGLRDIGFPNEMDRWCVIPVMFKPKKGEITYLGTTTATKKPYLEMLRDVVGVIINDAKKVLPEAIIDRTGMWWIGDNGFNPTTKERVRG